MKVKRYEKQDVDKYKVGDVINLKLKSGEKHQMTAYKVDRNGAYFVFRNIVAYMPMWVREPNGLIYSGSAVDNYLRTEFKAMLPSNVRKSLYDIRLLSKEELSHSEYFDEVSNRVAGKVGAFETDWYWLSDKGPAKYANTFAVVYPDSVVLSVYMGSLVGVRPVLYLAHPCKI